MKKNSIWIRHSRSPKQIEISFQITPPPKSMAERISSYVPIAISILALFVAIFAQWQSIRHSKLSVRPHVNFLTEDNFEALQVGLFLENNGLGPARVERLTVYFDGRPVRPRDMDAIYDQTRLLFSKVSPQWYVSDYAFNLRSGERIGVFFSPPANIANPSAFRNLVEERIFVVGEACSAYSECEVFCTKVSDDICLEEEKRVSSRVSTKKQ